MWRMCHAKVLESKFKFDTYSFWRRAIHRCFKAQEDAQDFQKRLQLHMNVLQHERKELAFRLEYAQQNKEKVLRC